MKLYWKDIEITKQSLASLSIKKLYEIKQSLAPIAYEAKSFKDAKLQALLLINNEISRKLIKARKLQENKDEIY